MYYYNAHTPQTRVEKRGGVVPTPHTYDWCDCDADDVLAQRGPFRPMFHTAAGGEAKEFSVSKVRNWLAGAGVS